MKDCTFCRIAEDAALASIVYSDEKVLAFMDIQPVNSGHMLIVPRVHASQLRDLDEETGCQIFKVAMRVSEALRLSNLRCEGVNLHLADGEAAGQEIFHVHLYVIPRFRGDGFGFRFGRHYGLRPDKKELDEVALSISENMR
jgi:histidine triad (HIT) family protein